jgi:hypothetical protein
MISKLDPQRFSTCELAMSALALATVALVMLVNVHALQPRDPSSAQPQSPLDRSRLETTGSINLPSRWESGETIRQSWFQVVESVGPTSANSQTSTATLNAAQLPEQTTETEPELNPQNPSDAIWVQARLADLGYFTGSRSGAWGPASRSALRDFKSINGLQEDDRWDRETEQRLSSKEVIPAAKTFIGRWAEDIDQCRNGAALVISSRAAKVVGGECDFRYVEREATAQWRVQAVCTDGGSSWNANVSLWLTAPKLIWSSERGTATYVRCSKVQTSSASLGKSGAAPLTQSFMDWLQSLRKPVFVHE